MIRCQALATPIHYLYRAMGPKSKAIRYVLVGLISLWVGQVAAQSCTSQGCGCLRFNLSIIDIPGSQDFDVKISACNSGGGSGNPGDLRALRIPLFYPTSLAQYTGFTTPQDLIDLGWAAQCPPCILNAENYGIYFENYGDPNSDPYSPQNCPGSSLVVTFHFTRLQTGPITFMVVEGLYWDGDGSEYDICGTGITGILLPLDLLQFSADLMDNSYSRLTWHTTNEFNSSHFEIERSVDGGGWENIGSVSAEVDRAASHDYTFMDHDISARHLSGQISYRLRIVDLDGAATLSPIATVLVPGDQKVWVVPNPASEILNIHWAGEAVAELAMYDMLGREVYAASLQNQAEKHVIDLSSIGLVDGVYFLQLLDGRQIVDTERIVVRRE